MNSKRQTIAAAFREIEIKGQRKVEMNTPAWTEVKIVKDIERCSIESNQEEFEKHRQEWSGMTIRTIEHPSLMVVLQSACWSQFSPTNKSRC